MTQHIIAMGGGGFSMETTPALDRYIVEQAGKPRPKVCYLPQAGGEHRDYILRFFSAFTALDTRPSWLSLFQPHTADIESYLMEQDVIYVGGGNTKSMLALWREWGIDRILKQANVAGTVLAGISAGAICWFEQGLTDSIPETLTALPCLGYLKGSATPHYDGEPMRRPDYRRFVARGELLPGLGLEDSAAAHFVDGDLLRCVCSRENAGVYQVEKSVEGVREKKLETTLLA